MDIVIGKTKPVGVLPQYKKKKQYRDVEVWTKEPQKDSDHCFTYVCNDRLYVLWGSVYEQEETNPAELAAEIYLRGGEHDLFDIDGEFIFAEIVSAEEMTLMQCNYGMQDIYYRSYDGNIVFTTEPGLLFRDYTENDIDEESVADFLLYGKMIGENTLSQKVKSIGRGQEIQIKGHDIQVIRNHMMRSEPVKEDWSIDEVTDELSELYMQSVWRRAEKIVDKSVLFLSGGQDSRLLLAAFNALFEKKVSCVSFGQFGAEEIRCAETASEIHGNPFQAIYLRPVDFLSYAKEYVGMTAGMDLFPQGNVLYVLNRLKGFSAVFPGSNLTDIFMHASFGREYLSSDMDKYDGNFSDYAQSHLSQLRLKGINAEHFNVLRKNSSVLQNNHLKSDTEHYNGYKLSETISAFLANSDAEHSIAFRTNVVPGKFMDVVDPASDKKFCKALMQVPIKYRLTDEIHLRMLKKIDPAYLTPLYNNTNLSLQFAPKYWPEASALELQREQLYERVMKEYNMTHEDKIYYPYYYSDFNGYTRYDTAWIGLMDSLLLDSDSFIYQRWLDMKAVKNMLEQHRESKGNYRKELILIASLEMFFRLFLKGGGTR